MVLGGLIIEACQNAGQERPERDWLIVGNVKCLVKEHEVRKARTAAGVNRSHMGLQTQLATGSTYNSYCGKAGAHCPACPTSFAGALNGEICVMRPHTPSCCSVSQSVLDSQNGQCIRAEREGDINSTKRSGL